MPRPRPDTPGAGQESVWDYPRPPRIEPVAARITIRLGGEIIADTRRAVRVLETSHPPVFYLPIADFTPDALTAGAGSSFCEFKGAARYLDVRGGVEIRPAAAWNYPHPSPGFEALADRVAVPPGGRMRGSNRASASSAPLVLPEDEWTSGRPTLLLSSALGKHGLRDSASRPALPGLRRGKAQADDVNNC